MINILKIWATALYHPLAWAMLGAMGTSMLLHHISDNEWWYLLSILGAFAGYYLNKLVRLIVYVWQ